MKNILNKIKDFFIKVKNWIVKMLKKTKFDNQLFALGVDKARRVMIDDANILLPSEELTLKTLISRALTSEFGKVPAVKMVLTKIINFADEKAPTLRVYNKRTVLNYINKFCDHAKAWYDKEF